MTIKMFLDIALDGSNKVMLWSLEEGRITYTGLVGDLLDRAEEEPDLDEVMCKEIESWHLTYGGSLCLNY